MLHSSRGGRNADPWMRFLELGGVLPERQEGPSADCGGVLPCIHLTDTKRPWTVIRDRTTKEIHTSTEARTLLLEVLCLGYCGLVMQGALFLQVLPVQ